LAGPVEQNVLLKQLRQRKKSETKLTGLYEDDFLYAVIGEFKGVYTIYGTIKCMTSLIDPLNFECNFDVIHQVYCIFSAHSE